MENLSIDIMFRSCANHCPNLNCAIAIPKLIEKECPNLKYVVIIYVSNNMVYPSHHSCFFVYFP